MSWTPRVAPEHADSTLAERYRRIAARSSRGAVSHYWQVLAVHPPTLDGQFECAQATTDDAAPLTMAQVELIAVVVSATNGCGYCVAHHGPRLARLVGEPLARAVARDYREADLTARDRVLLDAAVALTCEPSERKQEDVDRLREYGFDDAAIVRATVVAAYFNSANRIACALGLELEPGVDAWEYGAQR